MSTLKYQSKLVIIQYNCNCVLYILGEEIWTINTNKTFLNDYADFLPLKKIKKCKIENKMSFNLCSLQCIHFQKLLWEYIFKLLQLYNKLKNCIKLMDPIYELVSKKMHIIFVRNSVGNKILLLPLFRHVLPLESVYVCFNIKRNYFNKIVHVILLNKYILK